MVKLISENRYEEMMRKVVEPGLAAMRETMDMPLAGGGTLHAEVYNRFDARKAVVMVHGYTESCEKYREMVWYFVSAGYSVFVMDQRGHGQSVRALEDTSITHVERFDQYLEDLAQFMDQVVRPRMGDAPLYLFAHSMGGAVGALALMEHPQWFKRAVLNAPMIKAATGGTPAWAAEAMARTFCLLGKGKERAFVGHPFDPAKEDFEGSHATSRARFDYYQNKRVQTPHLQNCSPTYMWLREAIGVTRRLLRAENTAKIETPLLLIQAGRDSAVCLPEQAQFVEKVSGARIMKIDSAKHEIYLAHNELLGPYLQAIFAFFEEADQEGDKNSNQA